MARRTDTDVLTLFDALVYTCQYRVVIDPASSAMARVMEWRTLLRERIGTFEGAFQMPGIVLLETELPPDYERDLCNGLERGIRGHAPFTLQISGIMHSEDRRSIHLGISAPELLAPLRDTMADHVRADRRIKKLGLRSVARPCLPIAAGLRAAQFNEAWKLLSPHPFALSQRVSDVVLMKREVADDSLDEHVRTFPLQTSY